jgi:WD40 repeat protein
VFGLTHTGDRITISKGNGITIDNDVVHFTLNKLTLKYLGSSLEQIIKKNDSFTVEYCRDKSIKIWDAKSFQLLKTISIEKGFDGHHLSINKIVWEPSTQKLISVGDDKLIKIWDIKF